MPMDFPDMDSLKSAAQVHKFRQPRAEESEREFRNALAHHVSSIDFIESQEIRNGVGWDKFSDMQNKMMIFESLLKNR